MSLTPDEVVDQFHQAYRARRLHIVAGGELSREAGVLTSEQIYARAEEWAFGALLDARDIPPALAAPDYVETCRAQWRESAGSVFARMGISRPNQLLPEFAFNGLQLKDLPVSSLHRQLAAMPNAHLFTVAHDPIIELAGSVVPLVDENPSTRVLADSVKGRLNQAVRHIFGWIQPDGVSGDLVLAPELTALSGVSLAQYENAAREIFSNCDALLFLGFTPNDPIFHFLLRQLPSELSTARIAAIFPSNGNRVTDWAVEQLLRAHQAACVWINEPAEAEPFLRRIKYGRVAEGEEPRWTGPSLRWREARLTKDQILSAEWQSLARLGLEQLIHQIEMLFPLQPRESLRASLLLPLRWMSDSPTMLHLVGLSSVSSGEPLLVEEIEHLTLAIDSEREEGVSGLAFADGLIYDSADEPSAEGPERNFDDEKLSFWLGKKGYRDWRSILSIPILDSREWIPVMVMAITSNLGEPFWAGLSDEYRKQLITTIRRTAWNLVCRPDELKKVPRGGVLSKRDTDSAAVAQIVVEKVRTPVTLINFAGYLSAEISSIPGTSSALQLIASLDATPGNRPFQTEVKITDGVDALEASFLVEAVCADWQFVPDAMPLTVTAGQSSESLRFSGRRIQSEADPNAATKPLLSDIYVNLYQRNRLVKTLHFQAPLSSR